MTLGNDFTLPDGEEKPAVPAGQNLPSVIVIQHENRGLAARLMPPALILFVALAISSYQRKTPVWPLIPQPLPEPVGSSPLAPAGPDHPPGRVTTKDAGAVENRPETPVPVPAVVSQAADGPAGKPEPARQPSPFDLDTADGPGPLATPAPGPAVAESPSLPAAGRGSMFQHPNPNPNDPSPDPARLASRNDDLASPPPDTPEPSRDEILRDIEREAEQKDAKRQDLEGLKKNARGLLLNEVLSKADTDRVPFRDELKELVTQMGDGAGKEIEKLSQRYDKDLIPQVKSAYIRQSRTASGRRSRPELVARLRALGVPEPLILDQICKEYHNLIMTRNGPRSEDEVRVRAARALLAIPVTPVSRKFAPPPAGPQSSRRQDADAPSGTYASAGTRR